MMYTMSKNEIENMRPTLRLVLGFEIAYWRQELVESLKEENVNEPESVDIAQDYCTALSDYERSYNWITKGTDLPV